MVKESLIYRFRVRLREMPLGHHTPPHPSTDTSKISGTKTTSRFLFQAQVQHFSSGSSNRESGAERERAKLSKSWLH